MKHKNLEQLLRTILKTLNDGGYVFVMWKDACGKFPHTRIPCQGCRQHQMGLHTQILC